MTDIIFLVKQWHMQATNCDFRFQNEFTNPEDWRQNHKNKRHYAMLGPETMKI